MDTARIGPSQPFRGDSLSETGECASLGVSFRTNVSILPTSMALLLIYARSITVALDSSKQRFLACEACGRPRTVGGDERTAQNAPPPKNRLFVVGDVQCGPLRPWAPDLSGRMRSAYFAGNVFQ